MSSKEREKIEQEFDAMESGLFALVHMLRKVKECAVELQISLDKEAFQALHPEAKATLTRCRDANVGALLDARVKIAALMEEVGDFQNNTDQIQEEDVAVTANAFALMQALPTPTETKEGTP